MREPPIHCSRFGTRCGVLCCSVLGGWRGWRHAKTTRMILSMVRGTLNMSSAGLAWRSGFHVCGYLPDAGDFPRGLVETSLRRLHAATAQPHSLAVHVRCTLCTGDTRPRGAKWIRVPRSPFSILLQLSLCPFIPSQPSRTATQPPQLTTSPGYWAMMVIPTIPYIAS